MLLASSKSRIHRLLAQKQLCEKQINRREMRPVLASRTFDDHSFPSRISSCSTQFHHGFLVPWSNVVHLIDSLPDGLKSNRARGEPLLDGPNLIRSNSNIANLLFGRLFEQPSSCVILRLFLVSTSSLAQDLVVARNSLALPGMISGLTARHSNITTAPS
jgi:hypothetical protein